MKSCDTIKIAVLSALTAMALPMTAQAALTFGNWDVTAGDISKCSTINATCNTLVTGEGFLQEQVSLDGATYIHTVITDPDASGLNGAVAYSDESYVLSGGTASGIAAKQKSDDVDFNFKGSTTLYTGWAATTTGIKESETDANLNISQSFSDKGVTGVFGDEFTSSFSLKINLDSDTGEQTGKSMSIGQIVEMGDGNKANISDIQRFVIEQRTGTMLKTASAQVNAADSTLDGLTLGTTSYDADGVPLNGTVKDGPITWIAGDDVMFVWLGQEVSDDSAGSGGLSIFGYESVTAKHAEVDANGDPIDVDGNLVSVSGKDQAITTQFATTFSTDVTDPVANNTAIGTSAEATPFNWDAATFTVTNPDNSTTEVSTWGAVPLLPTAATFDSQTSTYSDAGACESDADGDGVCD